MHGEGITGRVLLQQCLNFCKQCAIYHSTKILYICTHPPQQAEHPSNHSRELSLESDSYEVSMHYDQRLMVHTELEEEPEPDEEEEEEDGRLRRGGEGGSEGGADPAIESVQSYI